MRATWVLVPGLAAAMACGRADGGEGATARAPSRAGEVWELDGGADRATAPAAFLAYLHGLHVIVLDGSRLYAGMNRLEGSRGPDGNRVFALAGGLEATLIPTGDRLELRFSTGETIPLRRREAP